MVNTIAMKRLARHKSRQPMTVSDIAVEVVRKKMKNMHLRILPPNGNVRVSVPGYVTDTEVYLFIVSHLSWIRQQQQEMRARPKPLEDQYISGESHYYQGKRYILDVIERQGKHAVSVGTNGRMHLYISPGTSKQGRARVLHDWYRQQLKVVIPELLAKWQPIVGKKVTDWGVKKMKTRWGSCNISDRRIWLNLELAKKSLDCLEYVLVHELVHLHERYHNAKFYRLMGQFLPTWQYSKAMLNTEPVVDQ